MIVLIFLAYVIFLLFGYQGGNVLSKANSYKRLSDISIEKLQALSKRSYYFGHQSVGNNIIEGLELLMPQYPDLKLNIEISEDAAKLKPGAFLHSRVGNNRDPQSKITAFEMVLDGGVGSKVDVSFLKFCYVDASKNSNAAEIFSKYKSSIEIIKEKYPETIFVHFTMPLKTVPTGVKVTIKNLIGKEIPEKLDNVVRGRFNQLLRDEYNGVDPLFDIAELETVVVGSNRVYSFKYAGKSVQTMALENTYDGGHLSDTGKLWVAEQLLVFLAGLNYKS